MRALRTILIIVFVICLGVFGASEVLEFRNRDLTRPEIASDREVLEISCDYTREDLLEGLTARDGKDGDLTDQIIAGSFSRFIEKGLCSLTYVVFDSGNQSASLTRQVRFTDYHSPRFTLTEPLVYRRGEGSYSLSMERLGAEDLLDGDLKDWIIQTDTDLNYQTPGSYTMTVEVSNSFGDTSSLGLPVHVVGEEQAALEIRLRTGILYVEQGETINPADYVEGVTDSQGNELGPEAVTALSSVDTETPGCYEISYEATDSAGATGRTWLTVVVEEEVQP